MNPGDRCSGINSNYQCNQCCEGACDTMGCHYFFSYCLRPAGSQVSYARTEYQGNCASINTTAGGNPIREGRNFTNSVFDIPNPIILSGVQWVSEISKYNYCAKCIFIYLQPVQLYLEIIDDDFDYSPDELVDRFAINVTTPVGTTSDRETYSGIFSLANIDISFRVTCTDIFSGLNCAEIITPTNANDIDDAQNNVSVTETRLRNVTVTVASATSITMIIIIIIIIIIFTTITIFRVQKRRANNKTSEASKPRECASSGVIMNTENISVNDVSTQSQYNGQLVNVLILKVCYNLICYYLFILRRCRIFHIHAIDW